MSFEQNDYLSWYMPRLLRGDGALNLHASGVAPLDLAKFDAPTNDPWSAVPGFEAALAAWLGCEPPEIVFTPGATGGTLLALLALAGPGAKLLVEGPMYEPMLRQAQRLGQVTRLERTMRTGFRLPLDDAERLITDDTALVMITEPHNPSGRFSDSDDVVRLARIARSRGATVLVNEVYRLYGERPSYHGAADNIVVVSSLSKLMGAYAARLGWISAPSAVAQRLRRAHLTMGMPNGRAAAVGMAIMVHADELRDKARRSAQSGVAKVSGWVRSTRGLDWLEPQGPGFGCVSLPPGVDDVALAETLHDEHGVLIVPGTMFEAPGCLRASWVQAGDELDRALEIVAATIKASRPRAPQLPLEG